MVRIGVINLPFGMNQSIEIPGDAPQEDSLYLALRNGDYPQTADISYNLTPEQYLKALEAAPYLETYSIVIKPPFLPEHIKEYRQFISIRRNQDTLQIFTAVPK